MTEFPRSRRRQQCSQQARIVALMQSNAWFIENVKDSREPGADLGRQSNSLRFTPGKRAALAIEREIAEPNFDEKLQARIESRAQRRGQWHVAGVVSSSAAIKRAAASDRQLTQLVNVQLASAYRSFMVTARISGLSLAPLHTLHGSYVMNDRMRLRVNSL